MQKKPRKAALVFIFVTVLLDVIGIGIIIPVIPSLIMELTGEGLSKAAIYGGWLMFVYSFMQFIFSPIIGGLSDRFGRRPVLLISLAGFGIDYIITGFASSIVWLFGARILAGIAGASLTTATAYIADVSEPHKRAQNFGLIGAAFGLGFIFGPVIGGILGEYGTRIPFFAAAGLTLLNFLYGAFVLPESLSPENKRPFDIKRATPWGSIMQIRKFPTISALIVVFFIVNLAHHATHSTWTYFTMFRFGWDEGMVGVSLGLVGVSVAIVQGGLTRVIIPKLGEKRAIFLGFTGSMFGFIGYAFAPTGQIFLSFIAVFAVGGFALPSLRGIISNEVDDNQQGEVQGALTSLVSLSSIFGPPLMTGIFGYFSSPTAPIHLPGAAFLLASFMYGIALILVVRALSGYEAKSTSTKN